MGKYQLYTTVIFICLFIPLSLIAQNLTDDQGRKTGDWRVKYPNGKLHYEASFEKGQPVGLMKRYNDMGTMIAEMNFIPNTSRCYTKLFMGGNHLTAEGLYINQKKDSLWTYYRSDKSVSMTEYYKDDLLHGLMKSYYGSCKISQVYSYENGKKNGQWMQYTENGDLMQSCNYTNDMLNGIYEAFNLEGQLEVTGRYVKDLMDGDWHYYTEEGEINQVLVYILGEIQNPDDLQENYDNFIKHIEDNVGNIPDPDDGDF
jgi:antitoxin component YwqK of YwqJK toxin-antitoxin module